jgi:tetratricopeptide (TPR) repeat protein
LVLVSAPISIKLRCASWGQLASIYRRDLVRNAIFLRSQHPPPVGTLVRIDLTLPSESTVALTGAIAAHVAGDDPSGRGPGVEVALAAIPDSATWLIERALTAARDRSEAAGAAGAAAAEAPSLHDGAAHADAEGDLVTALTAELDALRRLNPFQVLGVDYQAGDGEVRTAFGELTKQYHPDRYARYRSPVLRELAAEIFILIRDAYRRLGDPALRAAEVRRLGVPAAPRASLPARPPPPLPVRAAPAPAVRIPPREAASPGPAPAREPTPPPASRRPSQPAAPAEDGGAQLAQAMLDAGKYDEALAYFRVLLRKNPADRPARAGVELAEGLRALTVPDRMEAAQRFETVLELDPANERAARELAEMRRQATNERKGMLARLLGRKE